MLKEMTQNGSMAALLRALLPVVLFIAIEGPRGCGGWLDKARPANALMGNIRHIGIIRCLQHHEEATILRACVP